MDEAPVEIRALAEKDAEMLPFCLPKKLDAQKGGRTCREEHTPTALQT